MIEHGWPIQSLLRFLFNNPCKNDLNDGDIEFGHGTTSLTIRCINVYMDVV